MAPPTVLLLTHSGDYFTIDRVEEAVRRRGGQPVRVDTDRFPSQLSLSTRFGADGVETWLETQGNPSLRLDLAHGIWSRRLWPGQMPAELDPQFVLHCQRESRSHFYGTLELLETARWVNRPDLTVAAEVKHRQLLLAPRCGLRIPPTLVTNAPHRARAFFHEHGGKVVTKLLGALSQSMTATLDFMYTSAVEEADLDALDGLQFAPQIFQPLLEKARELRVVAVGDQLFTGAIDCRDVAHAQIDWRRATTQDPLSWTHAELPAEVAEGARRLMRALGLVYGALDFIVTPDGAHHFLEINPAGEWGWLERDLELPISDALAAELLKGAHP